MATTLPIDAQRTFGFLLVATIAGALATPLNASSPPQAGTQDGQQEGKRPGDDRPPVPKIPLDKLPRATAPKPDPKRDRYARDPVFVRLDTIVIPRTDEPYVPEAPILERYVAEYFRRAGHPVTRDAAAAKHRIVGNFECRFLKDFRFRGQIFAVKFTANAAVEVLDEKNRVVAKLEIPPLEGEGIVPGAEGIQGLPEEAKRSARKNPEPGADAIDSADPDERKAATGSGREEFNAVLDLRRRAAKVIWDHVYPRKGPFSDGSIQALIDSLTVDDVEADEPVDGDDVLRKLIARRFEAVPFLLEALADTRPVLVSATYPGSTPLTASKLRVYHLADKGLEEIFQKVSRMGLDTPQKHRFLIIKGWENEWRRFCSAYRESPETAGRRKTASTGR